MEDGWDASGGSCEAPACTVRKELEHLRRYVRTNMHSTVPATRTGDKAGHAKCSLLDEFVIIPFATLQEMTKYPCTLEVTENRQFRERGLLHITDGAFLFFKHMEEMRVSLLRVSMLSKAVVKSKFVHDAVQTIHRDDTL